MFAPAVCRSAALSGINGGLNLVCRAFYVPTPVLSLRTIPNSVRELLRLSATERQDVIAAALRPKVPNDQGIRLVRGASKFLTAEHNVSNLRDS